MTKKKKSRNLKKFQKLLNHATKKVTKSAKRCQKAAYIRPQCQSHSHVIDLAKQTTMMGVQSSKVRLWEVVLYLLESGAITCSGEVLRGDWTSTKTYYK